MTQEMETILVAIGAVILVQVADFWVRKEERKATSRTLLTLLESLAVLSAKQGYPSWITYFERCWGREDTLSFINQLCAILERNKVKDKQLDEARVALKGYLKSVNRNSREEMR